WPLAALVAAQVFVNWEALTALLYGQSHFLYNFRERYGWDWRVKLSVLPARFGILGSITRVVVLLALRGLRVSWLGLGATARLAAYGYAVVANVAHTDDTRLFFPDLLLRQFPADRPYVTFQEMWFGAWGMALMLLLAGGIALLLRLWPPLPRRFDQPMVPWRS